MKRSRTELGSGQGPVWGYPRPEDSEKRVNDHLKDYVAFYPFLMGAYWIGEENVHAQEGDFYGGCPNSNIVGTFKGSPGTWGW